MKLSCPACGAIASLDILLGHEGARDAVILAMRLPAPLGKQLIQYVGLFRPASRQLSMDRLAAILGELLPMIESARIERAGRIWAAPVDIWKAAIDEILAKRDRLTLPLKSQGYLLEIIVGMSNKAEGKTEAMREQQLAYAYSSERQPGMTQVADAIEKPARRTVMPESVREQLKNFGK